MEEVMRSEFVKLIGQELSDQLIGECDAILIQLGKEHSNLIAKYVDLLKEKQNYIFQNQLKEFPKHVLEQIARLIISYSVDALYCIMIMHAADCAIMVNTKVSVFVSRVMYMWENSVDLAKSYVFENALDRMMKSRPEPSKENLS
jgi:hypothetical protein